ncbi:MAG: bacteriohemerythrin [Azoarcus sp.]|jgi:hemerythrin|nr:bacteriohemerythrin [Azoarcus sp.]
MPFMPWSDAFILGIDSIDKQHRWLVDATNRLYDEIESRNPEREVLKEILEGLVDYTVNHFIVEEDLFNRLGYPEEKNHRARHDEFARHALELLLKFEKGESVSEEMLRFLQSWLINHIMKEDRAYVPFLKEKGVN